MGKTPLNLLEDIKEEDPYSEDWYESWSEFKEKLLRKRCNKQ